MLKFCKGTLFKFSTIFALSSGTSNKSPIAIIRISGPEAWKTLNLLHDNQQSLQLSSKIHAFSRYQIKERYAHFKTLYTSKSQIIDKGILIYFPQKSSYNGQDILELQVHGGKSIIKCIFKELQNLGFRLAERGQFTKRAIINNKLDILQAQGIHELIVSDNDFSRKIAINHLMGHSSQYLQKIKKQLINCLASSQAFIDFQEQESDVKADLLEKTKERVKLIMKQIDLCLSRKNHIQLMKEGINITILGKPNAGKSTLINKIVKKQVAIVSEIPGTTRDIIQMSIQYKGIILNFSDTAGIRESDSIIEKEGIKRALDKSKQSHFNLILIDGISEEIIEEKKCYYIKFKNGSLNQQFFHSPKSILILNKKDLLTKLDQKKPIKLKINNFQKEVTLVLSALQNIGIEQVLDTILIKSNQIYKFQEFKTQIFISKERHFKAFEQCQRHLNEYVRRDIKPDIACEELREAIHEIGSVMGKVDVEQVLDVLFKQFCIGK